MEKPKEEPEEHTTVHYGERPMFKERVVPTKKTAEEIMRMKKEGEIERGAKIGGTITPKGKEGSSDYKSFEMDVSEPASETVEPTPEPTPEEKVLPEKPELEPKPKKSAKNELKGLLKARARGDLSPEETKRLEELQKRFAKKPKLAPIKPEEDPEEKRKRAKRLAERKELEKEEMRSSPGAPQKERTTLLKRERRKRKKRKGQSGVQ